VVVARFSKDNLTRHRGGDLGWIDPDDMNPAFWDALRRLPVMGAPEIIRTPRGLHLVQVTDRAQGDAHLLWKRIEARRIMAEKLRQHRLQSRIERYLP
jgi:peptidyl-prolyl cis-trans isomerase SurA